MNIYAHVLQLLAEIEAELKSLSLWQAELPSAEALASRVPFCIDTLTFEQWLQFVFLVKMQQLVVMKLPLPTNVAIFPMAEESFKQLAADTGRLEKLILTFDNVLGAQ